MSLKSTLSEALDDIASSLVRRTRALDTLERLLAETFASGRNQAESEAFLRLQDGFECNIASRLMYSICTWLPKIQQTAEFSIAGAEQTNDLDINPTSRIIVQSLSILQGIALLHLPSKTFLGKKWCIQVFINLLAISWHPYHAPLSTSTNTVTSGAPTTSSTSTLASSSIDTLLCVLVDSPAAMRAFEIVDGVEVVVKTLKKTGVPRDIRMKCLEFLYFYLLDETGQVKLSPGASHLIGSEPREDALLPPLVVNGLSSHSSTPDASPKKRPRNLGMLRKDVDFVPVTPKRAKATQRSAGTSHARHPYGTNSPSKRARTSPGYGFVTHFSPSKRKFASGPSLGGQSSEGQLGVHRKSTEEKKELLGNLLGNVDSLVESVAKSGIWGLG